MVPVAEADLRNEPLDYARIGGTGSSILPRPVRNITPSPPIKHFPPHLSRPEMLHQRRMRLALLLIAFGIAAQASTILTVTGVECADAPHGCLTTEWPHTKPSPVLFSMLYDGCTMCRYDPPDNPFYSQYYLFTLEPDLSVIGEHYFGAPSFNHFTLQGTGEISDTQSPAIHNPEPGTWVLALGSVATGLLFRRRSLFRRGSFRRPLRHPATLDRYRSQ